MPLGNSISIYELLISKTKEEQNNE